MSFWCILFLDGKQRLNISVFSCFIQQIFCHFFTGPKYKHSRKDGKFFRKKLKVLILWTRTVKSFFFQVYLQVFSQLSQVCKLLLERK